MEAELIEPFDAVVEHGEDFGEAVSKKTLEHCVSFGRLRRFISINLYPSSRQLIVHMKLDPATVDLREGFALDVTGLGHTGIGDLEVRVTDQTQLEGITVAHRRIRLVPDEHRIEKPSATRVSMTVVGIPGCTRRPSFDELVGPSRAHRAVNQLLGRAVAVQAAEAIQVGDTVLGRLLGADPQLRHPGDYAGHSTPLSAPGLRLAFPCAADAHGGPRVEVMLEAGGAVSCHGPGDPYPEVTDGWLAVVDRRTGAERGTVRAALASLAERVFTDPDLTAAAG